MGSPSAGTSHSRLLRASKESGWLDARAAGASPDRNSRTYSVAQTVAQRNPSRIQRTDGRVFPAICHGRSPLYGVDDGPDPGVDSARTRQNECAEKEEHVTFRIGVATGIAWRPI